MRIKNNKKSIIKGKKLNIKLFTLTILTIICIVTTFTGCTIAKDKSAAEDVAKVYFDQIKDKNYDKASEICADEFFQKTSRKDFVNILQTVNKKLGDIKSYKLESWKVTESLKEGTYYYLTYKVEYSKYSSEEQFTLCMPKGAKDIKLIKYNINSEGLLKE